MIGATPHYKEKTMEPTGGRGKGHSANSPSPPSNTHTPTPTPPPSALLFSLSSHRKKFLWRREEATGT